MEFRDLAAQYRTLQPQMDAAIGAVCAKANFIRGKEVVELEEQLANYVGAKHCITCADGTDALTLALMAWNIGPGDAVFVPDFTFFASGETASLEGATAIFVDVSADTFNMDAASLEQAVETVLREGELTPRVVVPVDLFGLPAEHDAIRAVARKYNLLVLEDGAQGFGGTLGGRRVCSFGDISTTSFFPAKPLGCYGDGGAIFTDNDDWAALIRSLALHGRGTHKYDNVRIGMNSRLDTLQAAVLQVKLSVFDAEVKAVNELAAYYTEALKDLVITPPTPTGATSSWAQYTLRLPDKRTRDALAAALNEAGIPTMIYFPIPMHRQAAYTGTRSAQADTPVTAQLCDTVMSLPMHPYLSQGDRKKVTDTVHAFFAR